MKELKTLLENAAGKCWITGREPSDDTICIRITEEDRKKLLESLKESEMKERAVVVTTEYRGVFFGYAKEIDGDIIDLRAARNCLFWSSDIRGFMGLAATGPSKSCKVGPAADISLRKITSVIQCTPEAAAAWEAAPWSR